jgi:hypothetical protein
MEQILVDMSLMLLEYNYDSVCESRAIALDRFIVSKHSNNPLSGSRFLLMMKLLVIDSFTDTYMRYRSLCVSVQICI